MPKVEEIDEENHLMLSYESNSNVRIERQWRKIDDSTVRETNVEKAFDYVVGQWEVLHRNIRDYDIDSNGRLIGDGSNWDGEGRLWREWAYERHAERLRIRFPWIDESELPDGAADV